ncbi:ABC transporter permease [Zhouia sp. PK063]|uniref:ABC transporter permease n=1 Tax=Zhouia sp. PK063 TaxID=3373602 RepID=UPI00378CE2E8
MNNAVTYVKEHIHLRGWFGRDFASTSLTEAKLSSPFWVMVQKEISDHIRSWRFIIMIALIILTCVGALYTSLSNLPKVLANTKDPNTAFVFLKLLTASDGTLPPFHVFIGFLGPLLGISLGFDAINSEHNNGTLVRLVAQPIHRDFVINSKFIGALIVISTLFFSLSLLIIGSGIFITGLIPSPGEFLRIIAFTILSIVYVSFWLNLAILFSVKFKQAATSALTSIATWLFFTVFYEIIVSMIAKAFMPSNTMLYPHRAMSIRNLFTILMDLVPSKLFTDATTVLLVPSVRSLGPLSMQQMYGAIPSTLPLKESLLIVWPELTGLIATTVVCFAISYYLFMRREIRTK